MELTIEQAKRKPANFLYIFADDVFLSKIKNRYSKVIRGKRDNQNKVLMLSAEKYGGTYDQYRNAISGAFVNIYGISPEQALMRLAEGKDVAGKNWKAGVFGVGATPSSTFTGTKITVNETNGYMMIDGKYLPVYDTVYKTNADGTEGDAFQQTYIDKATGNTYMSQYDEATKKWYAASISDANGNVTSATGATMSASEQATMWGAILLNIENFINWLISLFGTGTKTINETNTLPNQVADGFVHENNTTEAGGILLALAAGGLLLGGGLFGKNKKK